ncbi:COMM domain-containing protein 4-like [Gigantopelta aegis]|uniref:COMM domain-containing protein 4-like n=1 Tax=Gigantopelta aegis TaxID=1735272 RepID=UPI001B88C007|nr:COMM domain-containing protein 4-like [Gigantopelta aegis]
MRFRFRGDLDCPDWVLAEISTLSKITSVKMKLLCVQVLKDMLGEGIDYDKVNKLTADAKFETGDVKASIAALAFILSSAARYNVDGETLSSEMQQLGLPKEHAGSLCKSYSDNLDKLQLHLRTHSLRLSTLESTQWRVDYILASSELTDINEPCVQVKLESRDPQTQTVTPITFTVSADKFRVLLNELKQADSMMDSLVS